MCSLGFFASPEATAGACAPCGAGTQPTDRRSAPMRARATRCSECETGSYSLYDADLDASYACEPCPTASSTRGTGAASRSDCLCVEDMYDADALGVVFGHPSNYNDSQSQFIMAASKVRRACIPHLSLCLTTCTRGVD